MRFCEHGEQMSLHLDGLLSAEEAGHLEAHLAQCEACRQQWEAMCCMSSLLQEEPAAAPAPDFTQRVGVRIEQRDARLRRLYSSIRVALSSLGLWTLASVALLLLFVWLWQASLPVFVFDVALPLARHILFTCAVVGKALWSVLHALATQPTAPLFLALCTLALALTVWWTRGVLRRWVYAPSSTA